MPRRIGRGTMGTGRRGKRWEANTVALIKSRAVFPRNAKKVVSSYLPEGSNRPLQFSRSPPLCARHERVRWSRLRAFVLFFREAFIGSRLLSPLYRLFLIHPCKTSLPIIRILLYPPAKRYLLCLSLSLSVFFSLIFSSFFFLNRNLVISKMSSPLIVPVPFRSKAFSLISSARNPHSPFSPTPRKSFVIHKGTQNCSSRVLKACSVSA